MFIPKETPPPTDPAVIDQLKSLAHKVNQLQAENGTLAAKMREIELRLRASEHNSLARLQNATSTSTPLVISPLHSPKTNASIPRFPRSEREIRLMSTLDVITILRALDITVPGSASAKKQRLREECGLSGVETSG